MSKRERERDRRTGQKRAAAFKALICQFEEIKRRPKASKCCFLTAFVALAVFVAV